MVCGGLWCGLWWFVVVCGSLWWFVVFSATHQNIQTSSLKPHGQSKPNFMWASSGSVNESLHK